MPSHNLWQPEELKHDGRLTWSTGRGVDVWALFCACSDGDLPTVKQLLAKDPTLARCHYRYRKPLYFAVRENQIAVVDFLLDHDPDPTGLEFNDSLLDITRDRGYEAMQRLLETKFADLHGFRAESEPIALAIRDYNVAQVRSFLDAAPDLLHVCDARGNQPLHWAVMTRQLDLIDELLMRGADVNSQRNDGARPIQLTNGDYHFRGWRMSPKIIRRPRMTCWIICVRKARIATFARHHILAIWLVFQRCSIKIPHWQIERPTT